MTLDEATQAMILAIVLLSLAGLTLLTLAAVLVRRARRAAEEQARLSESVRRTQREREP